MFTEICDSGYCLGTRLRPRHRDRVIGTQRLEPPPMPKLTGSRAACPSIQSTFPNSAACAENWAQRLIGCTRCRDCDIACVWNSDLTVCGLDLTMRTLCFNAYFSYALRGDVCRILRTLFVITVFWYFVRLGTTMVPHTWNGRASWLAVSRRYVCNAFTRGVSRSCVA